jgi:hypothetical protein
MIERVTELQGRVQSARAALEGLAERAANLRARLESAAVVVPAEEPEGTQLVSADVAEALPAPGPEASALASSLERLNRNAWVAVSANPSEGDDGRFVSDAWEIALISEEGK